MARAKSSDALRDWIEDEGTPLERRALILSGPMRSPCAYVGVPENSPLAGKHYDEMPLDVHGGLTFAAEGHGSWPKGWYWYGWDYSHSGDFMSFAPQLGGHQWTVEEIEADTRDCSCQDRRYRAVVCAHQRAVRLWMAAYRTGEVRPRERSENQLDDLVALLPLGAEYLAGVDEPACWTPGCPDVVEIGEEACSAHTNLSIF